MIAIYAVSIIQLEGLQGPLASLNMAMHVIYRFSHMRMLALMLAASVSSGPGQMVESVWSSSGG